MSIEVSSFCDRCKLVSPSSAPPHLHSPTHADDAIVAPEITPARGRRTTCDPRTTTNILSSPRNATIRVGFHREWELHRCKDLRVLETLPRIWASEHTESFVRQYPCAGDRVWLFSILYAPPFLWRTPVDHSHSV